MKKKGFTLIELLAVIVILAIIALIATPMVLNTIDDARKGAAKSSAYSYIEEVETEVAKYMLDNNGVRYSAGKYDISTLRTDLKVEVKGDAPSAGNICIGSNGTVTKASLKINNYVVNYDGKETTTTDLDEVEDIACDAVVTYQEYYTGTKEQVSTIYYNPETNTKCTETDYNNNADKLGKTGCMKWYAIENSGSNKSTVDVILDHNTTATIVWSSRDTSLESDISTWDTSVKATARLIEADEVAQIVGANEFDQETTNYKGSFDFSSIDYAWLYDYTYTCTSYNCNVEDLSTRGYWTSTFVADYDENLWRVDFRGMLRNSWGIVGYANDYGIRPVITISKNVIK